MRIPTVPLETQTQWLIYLWIKKIVYDIVRHHYEKK